MPATEEDELVTVGEWDSLDQAHEHALVVLAMNRECQIRNSGAGYALEVERPATDAVRREISLYAEEQAEWRERVEFAAGSSGTELAMLWVVMLMLAFAVQNSVTGAVDWGSNSTIAIFVDKEWWRPLTALFLHGDMGHLLGNVLIGGVFCVLVAKSFGQWLGWALILASGVIGNTLTAALHWPGPFRSIGASTATFGALGVLVGMSLFVAIKVHSYRAMKPALVPLGVGLALLGWFGVGGADTDVAGHLCGWLAGIVLGVIAGPKAARVTAGPR